MSSLMDDVEDWDKLSEEEKEDIKYFGGTIYNGVCMS